MENTMASRITQERLRAGLSKGKLAKALGVSRTAVSLWETEGPKGTQPDGENLLKLVKEFKCNAEWLQSGIGARESVMNINDILKDHSIPLLDWSSVDQILKVCLNDGDIKEVPRIKELPLVFSENDVLSKYCFGLIVRGNAMAPDENEGDYIIVDPTLTPSPKDSVIFKALSDKDDIYKLRQYIREEDGKFYLRANNKDEYPQIAVTKDIQFGGVVVFTMKSRLSSRA